MGTKAKTEPVVCPECGGAATVLGDRYTEPLKECPTCKGEGTVKATGEPDTVVEEALAEITDA